MFQNWTVFDHSRKYSLDQTPGPLAVQSIISDRYYFFIMSISLGIVCQIISVFGTASNIINILIFIKQGFSDSVNISLLALAISDLCSLLTIMWSNLCFSPAVRDSSIPMITYQVQLITGSWPHVVFTRITGWITAFISLERCVCVIFPLKVRIIFSRRRHVITMVIIYLVTCSSHSLAYISIGINWVFYPSRNQTVLGLAFLMEADKRKVVDAISYVINGAFMPISCFLSVVTCTVFLVVKLKERVTWRQCNTSACDRWQNLTSKSEGRVSKRDERAAKMVVLISGIFITSFIPAVITYVVGILVPELSYDGLYKNMFLVVLSVSFTTEAINSSMNICIYLTMSTKYKDTFMKTFRVRTSQPLSFRSVT